jgi:putative flippase GtrA
MSAISHLKESILENYRTFLIFLFVGGLTAGFYISFFTLLLKIAHLHYQLAISIAYVVSVTLYFIANRQLTFKNSNSTVAQQLPKYFFLLLINYLVTLSVMHGTVEMLGLPPYFGIISSIGLTFIVSYSLSRFWIFKTT